jgi:hypothetical protein
MLDESGANEEGLDAQGRGSPEGTEAGPSLANSDRANGSRNYRGVTGDLRRLMPIPTETMRERRIWRVTVMASAVLAALSILFSVLLYEQGQDRAHTNRVLALKAQRLAGEIQAQRINAIRTSCEAQNQRNVKTIKTLDGLIAKLPSKQRPRAQAGRDNTVLLINALAPKQNCAKVVQEAAPVPPKPVPQPKPAPTR